MTCDFEQIIESPIFIIDSPNPILKAFLQSQHNPEISWNELEKITENSDDAEEDVFVLDGGIINFV